MYGLPGTRLLWLTLSEFVTINRMYRDRDFEFVSIC